MLRCADDHNVWFVEDPEKGWLHGRFWKCSHKLCSFCLSAESRRRRRALLDAIDALPARKRKWHFLTFTIENPSASIVTTREIVNDAWSKLRKRGVFAEVRACAKSEEFTITKLGFHYHIHTIIDSDADYLQSSGRSLRPAGIDMKRSWTECVENSGGASRNLFGYQTYDQYLIVDFREVENPKNIVNELGKYITKSTSFRDLSRETLNELASVKRWHRMFELLGDLRKPREAKPKTDSSTPIVHTKRISDGEFCDLWLFEKRREANRFFMVDALENKFNSSVFNLAEMRQVINKQNET